MLNDSLFYETYEIIGGEKIMSAMTIINHSGILFRLGLVIGNYVVEKNAAMCFQMMLRFIFLTAIFSDRI